MKGEKRHSRSCVCPRLRIPTRDIKDTRKTTMETTKNQLPKNAKEGTTETPIAPVANSPEKLDAKKIARLSPAELDKLLGDAPISRKLTETLKSAYRERVQGIGELSSFLKDALGIDDKFISECASIAKDIVTRVDKLIVKPRPGETTEKFFGTPAVVFFNVLNCHGIIATRISDHRDRLKKLSAKEKKSFLAEFDRDLTVFCLYRMEDQIDAKFLDALRDADLKMSLM